MPARRCRGADLARAAKGRGTLVILMGTARLRENLARLIAGGLPDATPAAAIQWGTTASQRTVISTIGNLADDAERAGLGAPAVIVVGECAALGADLGWYERMPLFGRRIIVTRAAEDAAGLIERLRALGAEAIGIPVIAVGAAVGLCAFWMRRSRKSDRLTGSSSPARKASRRSCSGCGRAATIFANWAARRLPRSDRRRRRDWRDFALTVDGDADGVSRGAADRCADTAANPRVRGS